MTRSKKKVISASHLHERRSASVLWKRLRSLRRFRGDVHVVDSEHLIIIKILYTVYIYTYITEFMAATKEHCSIDVFY